MNKTRQALLALSEVPGREHLTYGTGNVDESLVTYSVVFYHAGCADGFGAAWAIHHAACATVPGVEILFIPVTYGNRAEVVAEVVAALEGQRVHVSIVDFSFPPEVFASLLTVAGQVVYLDHHAGAQDLLADAAVQCERSVIQAHVEFNNDHSGCWLAWKYFNAGAAVPRTLACIEDRDLWRFDIAETKQVCANVYSYPMEMAEWDALMARPFEDVAEGGVDILRAHNKNVEALCRDWNVSYATFHGYRVAVVNCPYFMVSDVCHRLLNTHADIDMAAGFQLPKAGEARWSFRARKDGVDLPSLLKQYGGGGHQAAAGVEFKNLADALPEAVSFYQNMQFEGM